MPSERATQKQRTADSARKSAHTQAVTLQATRRSTPASIIDHPQAARAGDILALQRQVGNRAVQNWLARRTVQPKLNVGPAGDRYEQEADRVASQVMTMPAPGAPGLQRQAEGEDDEPPLQAKPLAAALTPLIQREAEGEDEEPPLQAKPLAAALTPVVQRQAEEEDDEPPLQAKSLDPRAGFEAGSAIEGQLHREKGHGSPLPADVRSYMEPRFGADFSDVRVHTGGEAATINRQLSAQAFTHGRDIYLGAGQYAPGTDAGKRLLAHELAHTIQQTGSRPTSTIQRKKPPTTPVKPPKPLLAKGPRARPLSKDEKTKIGKYKTGSVLEGIEQVSGMVSEPTEGPKGITEGMSDAFGKWAGEFKEDKVDVFDKSSPGIDLAGSALGGVGATFGLISEMSKHLKGAIGQAKDKKWGEFAQTLVLEMGSTLIDKGGTLIVSGGTIGTTIASLVKAAGGDTAKTVFGFVGSAISLVKNFFSMAGGIFKNIQATRAAFKEGIWKGLGAMALGIGDAVKGVLAMVGDVIGGIKQALDSLKWLQGVAQVASSVFACATAVITALTAVWDGIKEFVTTIKVIKNLIEWKKLHDEITKDPEFQKETELAKELGAIIPEDAKGKKLGEWGIRRAEVNLDKRIKDSTNAEKNNQQAQQAKTNQIKATQKEITDKETLASNLDKEANSKEAENKGLTSKEEQGPMAQLKKQMEKEENEKKNFGEGKKQSEAKLSEISAKIKDLKAKIAQEQDAKKRAGLQDALRVLGLSQRELQTKSKKINKDIQAREKSIAEIDSKIKALLARQGKRKDAIQAVMQKKTAVQKEIDSLKQRETTLMKEKKELVDKGPKLHDQTTELEDKKKKLGALKASWTRHLMVKELATINRKRVNRAIWPIVDSAGRHGANAITLVSALTTIGVTIASFAGGISAGAAPALAAASQLVGSILSGGTKALVSLGGIGRKLVRTGKQWGRDLSAKTGINLFGYNTAKTSKAKQEKRATDAVELLELVAGLPAYDEKDPNTVKDYQRAHLYLQATGVNIEELLEHHGDHVRQGKMLMEALAMRESKD